MLRKERRGLHLPAQTFIASRHRGLHPWKTIGTDAPWSAPWTSTPGSSIELFRKDDHGFVHLVFEAQRAIAGPGGGTIFTLPVGFRPPYRTVILAYSNLSQSMRLDVNTDGTVVAAGANSSVNVPYTRFRNF